jgi:hypothetical protein
MSGDIGDSELADTEAEDAWLDDAERNRELDKEDFWAAELLAIEAEERLNVEAKGLFGKREDELDDEVADSSPDSDTGRLKRVNVCAVEAGCEVTRRNV